MSTVETRSKKAAQTKAVEMGAAQSSSSTDQSSSTERTTTTEQSSSTGVTASTDQTRTTEYTTSTEQTTNTEGTNGSKSSAQRSKTSRTGTVVAVQRAPSHRTSTSSRRRRAELEAQLELQQKEKEKADAAAALARTRLELIRLEETDLSASASETEDRNGLVSEWVQRSAERKSQDPRKNPRTASNHRPRYNDHVDYETNNDQRTFKPRRYSQARNQQSYDHGQLNMNDVAAAMINAVNNIKVSSPPPPPSKPPRYLNELHPFSGDPREWIAFKATYRDTENYFLQVENMARLRKAIQGKARTAVMSTLYSSNKPEEIMDMLERHFGRPTLLIKSEIAALDKIRPMSNDMSEIGNFACAVANSVNTIKQINRKEYLHSTDVADRIIEKMNNMVRFRWHEFHETRYDEPILISLSAFLNKLTDQFETCSAPTSSPPKFVKKEPFRMKRRVNATNYISDSSDSENENVVLKNDRRAPTGEDSDFSDSECERERQYVLAVIERDRRCILCKAEHEITKCPDFLKENTAKRWEIIKKTKICFKCLKGNHRSLQCRANPCHIEGCQRRHHSLLHDSSPKPEPETNRIVSVNHISEARAYLKIVPVELTGPTGTITVAALLDEGSTVTLLLSEVADQIGATGPERDLSIEGVSGHLMRANKSKHIKLRIKGIFARQYENIEAFTINQLNLASQAVRKQDITECPHLLDIEDQITYEKMKPALLIGQDNWHLIVTRELKSGHVNKPVASLTKLGWILHGCNSGTTKPVLFINHLHQRQDDMEELMRAHFSLDSLGITQKKPSCDTEQRALTILEKTTKHLPDGRFECGLLWRTDNETMPSNRQSALRRLTGIEKKMNKSEDFRIKYTEQVENLLKSGYAEPAPTTPSSPRTWYLPHFAVIHPQKGKMRLVFDAAERTNGKCLNDALLTGPDLLQSLFGVLIRFRQGPIAVAADIKEMFLRIKICQEDRDSLRFLWRGNKDDPEPSEYRMNSLIFGAASSPCSAIYAKNRNAEEHEAEYPEAVHAIKRCHYMDDYLQSFETVAQAQRISSEVDMIHKKGGFELRGWASNCQSMLRHLVEPTTTQVELGTDNKMEKTLGMLWDTTQDALKYTLNLRNTPEEVLHGMRPPTKRQVTSAVLSVFDPLGLATPVLIQGKKLIQSLWKSGVDWDEQIPEKLIEKWNEWISSLDALQNLDIPRCTDSYREGQLHTFVDASETAYAAATYYKSTHDGKSTIKLMAAKAKVAPLKPTSIPRLELQAALLGCRLASSVQEEMLCEVTKRYFWSDSRTVLAWIKSDPRTFKPFVAHRLAEIEDLSKVSEWRWIPTSQNVADDATRATPREFNIKHRWFTGPDFLLSSEDEWPKDTSAKEPALPTGEERNKTVLAITQKTPSPLPDPSRFSSWKRLHRATARFLQYIDVFKSKLLKKTENVNAIKKTVKDKAWRQYERKGQKKRPIAPLPQATPTRKFKPLTEFHLKQAEKMLIKTIQAESFKQELAGLKENKPAKIKDSPLRRLSLILKDDVIHIETRLSAAPYITNEYKQPAVLDGKHPITKLIIRQYHEDFNHGNHNTVMNEIRQRFYITSLRNTIKSIALNCQWCKVHRSLPKGIPTGDLPPERLQNAQPPFYCTGVDYFGPITITIGRRNEKRWIALYTCLTTRAVHLEIASSLSTDSMILTLRRMAARRGMPKVIYSDNATCFTSANKELQMNLRDMAEATNAKGITWKFIPPGAPNMGGAWERLVRSVKTALYATLKERQPREEVLHTLLLEAEHLVNSRPLTDVSLNPDDEESLTPNHFLIGRSSGATNPGEFTDSDLIGPATWRTTQRLADKFWNRWITEYLPTLAPRYNTGHGTFENPAVGDVVLIVDSSLPRGTWPRGEIVKVFPGPDKKIRIATVRTTAGEIRRPVSRLIKITAKIAESSPQDQSAQNHLRTGGGTVDDPC